MVVLDGKIWFSYVGKYASPMDGMGMSLFGGLVFENITVKMAKRIMISSTCEIVMFKYVVSGQVIATSHDLGPQNVVFWKENGTPCFTTI